MLNLLEMFGAKPKPPKPPPAPTELQKLAARVAALEAALTDERQRMRQLIDAIDEVAANPPVASWDTWFIDEVRQAARRILIERA